MLPPMRNASPPNIFFSTTGSPSSVARIRSASSSSYATLAPYGGKRMRRDQQPVQDQCSERSRSGGLLGARSAAPDRLRDEHEADPQGAGAGVHGPDRRHRR